MKRSDMTCEKCVFSDFLIGDTRDKVTCRRHPTPNPTHADTWCGEGVWKEIVMVGEASVPHWHYWSDNVDDEENSRS